MNIELYVIPLGNNKFQSIVVRDGTVSLDQLEKLIGNDGLALQLIRVEDFSPATVVELITEGE